MASPGIETIAVFLLFILNLKAEKRALSATQEEPRCTLASQWSKVQSEQISIGPPLI